MCNRHLLPREGWSSRKSEKGVRNRERELEKQREAERKRCEREHRRRRERERERESRSRRASKGVSSVGFEGKKPEVVSNGREEEKREGQGLSLIHI